MLVFNGEVYNHRSLRAELESEGCKFRGHSDTEVILAAFEQWGIERATRRFVGMFAIAVWDLNRRELSLVRDRLGIKPMFVYHHDGLVSFGSELKALFAGPEFDRTLDTSALTAYLRYLYVPAPQSIFRHAFKLLPGHILTITDPEALTTPYVTHRMFRRRRNWTISEYVCEENNRNFVDKNGKAGVDLTAPGSSPATRK